MNIEQILEENVVCSEELTAWGFDNETAISITNDFYLNTQIPAHDLKQYIDLFNLEPLLRVQKD